MSKNRRNARKYREQNKSNKPKESTKKTEINIDDADINDADLRPMERKRRSKDGDNDYSWYNHYPELLRNVTGVVFGKPLGSHVNWKFDATVGTATQSAYNIPGIMTIHMIPTIGSAEGNVNSPVNKASFQLYAAMRKDLGSVASYDHTDTMLYLLAIDSAYLLYALTSKIYGCMRMASPQNYYFMKALVESMQVDYASFFSNMAQFRATLNRLAIYLGSFMVPADFDFFRRHVWMMQNIFTDSNTAKAQMYQYMLDGIYIYTEVTDGPAYLKYTALNASTADTFTYDDFVNLTNEVLLSLQSSQDIAQMSADIGKAFAGNTFLLSLIPEEYVTPITYSQEVLSQIENTILVGQVTPTEQGSPVSVDITQDVSLETTLGPRIVQNLWTDLTPFLGTNANNLASAARIYFGNYLLNFHYMDPPAEMIMVATRNMPRLLRYNTPDGFDNPWFQWGSRGSEVCTFADMCSLNDQGQLLHIRYVYVMGAQASAQFQSNWSCFDWAPSLFEWTSGGTAFPICDIDNYAMLDNTILEAMNECAILSEFHSPKFVDSTISSSGSNKK